MRPLVLVFHRIVVPCIVGHDVLADGVDGSALQTLGGLGLVHLALDDFLDESYLRSHSQGTLLIGRDGKKQYGLRVFASARVSAGDDAVFDVTAGGAAEFARKKASVWLSEPKGRIVALSTCADSDTVTRVVVFCYIVE